MYFKSTVAGTLFFAMCGILFADLKYDAVTSATTGFRIVSLVPSTNTITVNYAEKERNGTLTCTYGPTQTNSAEFSKKITTRNGSIVLDNLAQSTDYTVKLSWVWNAEKPTSIMTTKTLGTTRVRFINLSNEKFYRMSKSNNTVSLIYSGGQLTNISITITDARGSVIKHNKNAVLNDNPFPIINMKTLKSGVYFVKVRGNNVNYSNQIVVNK